MPSSLDSLQQRQIFMRLLIFSLITVMVWVFFSLFRTQQQTQIPPELLKLAEPLNPTIDLDTLNKIEQERGFSASDMQGFSIYRIERDPTSGQERISTVGNSALPASSAPAGQSASSSGSPATVRATPTPTAPPATTEPTPAAN